MSLIEEAMRRLQDPLISKTQSPSSVQHPAPRQAHKEPVAPPHSWPVNPPAPFPSPASASPAMNRVTFAVIAMAVCFIGGGVWWMGRTGSAPSLQTKGMGGSAVKPSATTPSALPPVSQSRFILSGIVEGLGEPYAVINGMILTVGDQIADATLLEINKGMVRLRLGDGSETTLRVPR